MKKLFLLLMMGGAFLTGCSNQSDLVTGEGQGNDEFETTFLSVSIAPTAVTRAASDYADGSNAENKIQFVRFFFFDDAGNAVTVATANIGEDNKRISYIDWEEIKQEDGNRDETVKDTIAARVLTINTEDGVDLPTQVLAVINPSVALKEAMGDTPKKDKLLKDLRDDYLTKQTEEGTFVMSNSVYVEEGKEINTTSISSANYRRDADEAKKHPVVIYVERVVARVDLSIDASLVEKTISDENGEYKIYKTNGKATVTGEVENGYLVNGNAQNIYVRILGWNVTGVPKKSYLVKQINPAWSTKKLFGEDNQEGPWTTADYHRSFWALNPQYDTTKGTEGNYWFKKFEEIDLDLEKVAYLHENANSSTNNTNNEEKAPDYPTKVIIGAQLVNEKGEPLQLAEWGSSIYTIAGVKTALVAKLNLYSVSTNVSGDVTVYDHISEEDIKFELAKDEPTFGTNDNGGENYLVKVVLSDEGKTKKWQEGNEEKKTPLTDVQLTQYIKNEIGNVMIWGDDNHKGYTYYYFDIRHLGNDKENIPARYGIVRNHIYKTIVKSIAGLGTPVYDPDQVIYPEHPKDDGVLAAEVKVLQWRVVKQEHELTW